MNPSASRKSDRPSGRATPESAKRKKLALLVNMVAPYRVPIYASLATAFDVLVLHGPIEGNRSWTSPTQSSFKTQQVWTWQIARKKKNGVPGVSDKTYLHLNLGLPWSLFRFRPDIVVSIEMGPRTVLALLYGKLARVPVWVWWGGTLHSEQHIGRLKRRLRSMIVRHASRWISYGATSTEYLRSIGVPRQQILQIQNCVPQETFLAVPPSPRRWFADEPRPVILAVGQLIQRKGLDKLIEACGRLASRGFSFTLVLVGQGSEHDSLHDLARSVGLNHFCILPNQPQTVLNEIYRSADAFVFPTMEDIWGLVVNEVMWTGTPVLCSQYAGCAAELVSPAEIFDPMSIESFDHALARIVEHSISLPDRSRLKTWQQIADAIRNALETDRPDGSAEKRSEQNAFAPPDTTRPIEGKVL
jgi:glycosyltransferase involved in cell wall biosynthesis